jgi:2-C-methyl-D-erythritol 4-phosphate cytidylyltransferase
VLDHRIIGLVPAAGRGERFGGDLPKQFLPIAGRPMLAWTIERLLAAGVHQVVVALPADRLAGDLAVSDSPRVQWIAGGATRQETVSRCLAAAPGADDDLVVVHDGARPAVAVEDIAATLDAAGHADGAVLGRPLADTLKRLEGERIETTVDRHGLFRAETPQVFRRAVFTRALALAERDHFLGTDESSLVERLPGARIIAVVAQHPNPKLTEPADRGLLERLLLHPSA